jgi:hypothetical protein
VKVGSKKFGDEVTTGISVRLALSDIRSYMSSRGEMKISLKLIICAMSAS